MGALEGVKVVELVGIGPGPLAGMLLADMGAEVIRVDRPRPPADENDGRTELLARNRRSIVIDMKSETGSEAVLRLARRADVLIDPYRPGVTERLGIGPDECRAENPRLIYGRVTGWGQDGPWKGAPGHDINYLSITGVLAAIGRRDSPVPPLNLLGDYGGGAMLLAFGIAAALVERNASGEGQVIDAAMVDGAALLSTRILALWAQGDWSLRREANKLDGGAHFYDVYETADGRHLAIGPLEPRFYGELLERLGLDLESWPQDRERWPELSERLAGVIRRRTRAQWLEALDGSDACVTPVLDFAEAVSHPHLVARGTYTRAFGAVHPAPAPRFSRTPGSLVSAPCLPGEHSREVLADWGFEAGEVGSLEAAGVIEQRPAGARKEAVVDHGA